MRKIRKKIKLHRSIYLYATVTSPYALILVVMARLIEFELVKSDRRIKAFYFFLDTTTVHCDAGLITENAG